jgi:hypothetical protein
MQFVRISISVLALALAASLAGCGPDWTREPVGSECSEEDDTLCDGLCLLDLPNGMCTHDCAADDGVCPDGYACSDIAGGRYCLKSCEGNGDCREDMICVVGVCRVAMPLGAACEEPEDCESGVCWEGLCDTAMGFGGECDAPEDCHSGVCYDGACNLECHSINDCTGGLFCIDPGDGVPVCVEYTAPEGPFGENCTSAQCADDFTCVARTPDEANDPYAFCTESCANELDCPADMTCRRTQRGGFSENVLRCVPRDYCEHCAYDAQCGQGNKCVSQAPDRGEGRYCSQTCDVERPDTTCPTDSTCHEALWCGPDRAWVADCAWCSIPDECGAPESGTVYQCFRDYGACAGEGAATDYCAPCWVDEDCPAGGFCYFEQYAGNAFCTAPCPDREAPNGGCETEHVCMIFSDADEQYQCVPRAGSCSQPSGGVTTCYSCADWTDCVSGQCLAWDLGYGATTCWEDCSVEDCPPYSQCYDLNDGTNTFHLCGPPEGWSCGQAQICIEECPEGPDSCSIDAPSRCL